MKIEINITKEEAEHLRNCNSEINACFFVESIIKKVKTRIKC